MTEQINKFNATLRKSGHSNTAVRKMVFEAMIDQEPLTMSELVRRLKDRCDRASIYRTVSLFEKLTIVERLQIGWKYKLELTDEFSEHHHHLTCLNCGGVTTVDEDQAVESRIHILAVKAGFQPKSHQLEIRGICRECHTGNSVNN
jgi:Fur family transcriptional regulator, ferric uptake regulator